MNCATYHIPVLLNETIDGLNIQPDGVYVDLTFGGGGHSRAILEKLGANGRLFSFDQDLDAMKGAFEDSRFQFVRSNFRYLYNFRAGEHRLPDGHHPQTGTKNRSIVS